MGHEADSYAVLDLGSNSFHMLIAQHQDELRIVDKLREPVRLADGLDEQRTLSEESQERALAALELFAQRIRGLADPRVRVVGTNTLRRAKNGKGFRRRVREVLGHPVEVISGDEEARLIYLGVAHTRSDVGQRRLVVDIGGGSTEVVVGRDFDILRGYSLPMGCVTWSRRHFPKGKLSEKSFGAADTAALLEVRAVHHKLKEEGWEVAIGCSGTINACAEILSANGWDDGRVSLQGLNKLRKAMIKAGHVDAFDIDGLRADRRPVLAGGLAVLRALIVELGIDSLETSDGALREGVLYDIIGRRTTGDVREETVRRLEERYAIDRAQSERVRRSARELWTSLGGQEELDGFDAPQILDWAARLHEVGHALRYNGHQRHGEYLLRNGVLPGFSRDDQNLLATLVRTHRRRPLAELFDELNAPQSDYVTPLCVVLRLAVLLNRSRALTDTPKTKGNLASGKIELRFPDGWFDEHPLTAADLEEEARYLRALGIDLSYRG